MSNQTFPASKAVFRESAEAFLALVRQIGADEWDAPGLGEWSVRDLVGHTSRSLITVENYLGTESTEPLDGPVEYYLACRVVLATDNGVAQRGRDAGAALGADPVAKVAELTERVTRLVEASGGDTPVGTPFGTITLASYLPTRSFELAVHSIDLTRALDLVPPAGLESGIAAACELAGRLAAHSADPASFLMAVTGRANLPDSFTVL